MRPQRSLSSCVLYTVVFAEQRVDKARRQGPSLKPGPSQASIYVPLDTQMDHFRHVLPGKSLCMVLKKNKSKTLTIK